MRRSVAVLVLVGAFLVPACGPWDPAPAALTDTAPGPRVDLTADRPRQAFRFTFAVNDVAMRTRSSVGFDVDAGRHVGLGYSDGPHIPLHVVLWRIDGDRREQVELRRGSCDGAGCVGEFEIVFVRIPTAQTPLVFDWRVVGGVSFGSIGVPDGATVDVSEPAPV